MPTEPIRKLQPGRSAPLGATSDGRGVNFAIWSGAATKVELCVFEGGVETRHELPANSNDVWHGFLPGAEAGLTYGYRVHGDYDPKNGNRFNPHKLLIDPYAKLLQGDVIHDSRLQDGLATKDGWTMDTRDSAPVMPKCVVIETQSDPRETKRPRTALADSVIYELHVKGYTRLHPDVPPALRGTYLGLAEPVIIEHLRRLKITAIELLPCASFMSEPELVKRGLSNYWGYNPAAFFAPHAAYAINDPIGEFQTMVRVMHEAGIEVLVDVVYNHTAEGNAHGPTLNFRGIDNAAYYQLRHHNRAEYVNNSGCGNSVAVNGPPVLKLVLDSLRYWTEVLGVDGFRFDLAASLARVHGEFDPNAAFLQAVYQDPVLSQCKLIAEPWDLGHAGYRLGQFPSGWTEWNDRYRRSVRAFWRGNSNAIGEFASRVSGSDDFFAGRGPTASLNYVTSHDGFTLHDLVSYDERHNQDNGENNADGDPSGDSWNHGVEGPSADPEVQRSRTRGKRGMLATLMFSQGIPMLLAGDELGRTQRGNNNAYCQDNEIGWLDWCDADDSLTQFVADLIGLRRQLAVFRRGAELVGQLNEASGLRDVQWFTASGTSMQLAQWREPQRRELAILLRGDLDTEAIAPRYRLSGDDVLILVNGSEDAVAFTFPAASGRWHCVLDTDHGESIGAQTYQVAGRSLVLLVSRNS